MESRHDRKQVKVIDRRWLTPEGETRGDSEPRLPEPAPQASPPADAAQPPAPEAPPAPQAVRAVLPSQVLLDTVDFLAQYAMAFLTGQVAGVPRDLDAARLYIDLLAVVQERARAHASLQEAKVLDDVLYQLRLQLVAASR